MSFVLVTDAVCDLNADLVESLGVKVLPMEFTIGDKVYKHYPDCREMSIKDFYQAIREGAMPTTSQININSFSKFFEPVLKEGRDILYLCFTSGLSGTYNTCMIAVSDLLEKYPERKIKVVDSACASLGEGNLVYHVAQKVNGGATFEEACQYAEETKIKVAHWFVVDDLEHLKRGGRISSLSATFGKALQIKPLLSVDDDGHLITVAKIRGYLKVFDNLVDRLVRDGDNIESQTVFIGHADNLEGAEKLKRMVEPLVGKAIIVNIGPVVGAHVGAGMLALTFIGKRNYK